MANSGSVDGTPVGPLDDKDIEILELRKERERFRDVAGSDGWMVAEMRKRGSEWFRLVKTLLTCQWGEATVVLKDGKPVMVRGLRDDVKLTDG